MIIPVILSGGPSDSASLLQNISCTVARVESAAFFSAPILIGQRAHADLLQQAMGDRLSACTVLEPFGRHTAAAVAIAALLAFDIQPRTPMLILPSDHEIHNNDAFLQAVHLTTPLVEDGYIVTFGVKPEGPETHYGYIEKGGEIPDHEFARRIRSFVEKPNSEQAAAMLETGNFYWNSGIVMASAETLLDEFTRFAPDILNACRDTLAHSPEQENIIALDAGFFERVPKLAFDVAVLEKTQKAVVLQAAFDWSDFGGDNTPRQDEHGNTLLGKAIRLGNDVTNSVIRNETGRPIRVSHISGLSITVSDDGVTITGRD